MLIEVQHQNDCFATKNSEAAGCVSFVRDSARTILLYKFLILTRLRRGLNKKIDEFFL